MKQKRGQVYIISAIIIIMIILGIAGVSNYIITQKEPTQLYDLSENLEIEGASIIDYGIYNNEDAQEKMNNFFGNFTAYLLQTEEEFELTIIYGTPTKANATTYRSISTGTIGLGNGGRIPTENGWEAIPLDIPAGITHINISGVIYNI